jgi:hypothetical protein
MYSPYYYSKMPWQRFRDELLYDASAPVLPPSSEQLVAKNKDGYDLSVPLREGGQDGKSIVLYSPRIARTAHISLYVYEEYLYVHVCTVQY